MVKPVRRRLVISSMRAMSVATGADGRVGISFTDGTAFNLSSNARMALSEFVYDPNGKVQLDLVQSDQGNLHFCCRQSREDG